MLIHLYVKRHKQTGLKYFGKTQRNDPFKYLGSGKYWKRHLKAHGIDVETTHIWSFNNLDECNNFALIFSESNNIVGNSNWANLKDENGLDGNPLGTNNLIGLKRKPHSKETRLKISQSLTGRICGPKHSNDFKQRQRDRMILNNPQKGKVKTKQQIEAARATGKRPKSEATKQKMREAALRRYSS